MFGSAGEAAIQKTIVNITGGYILEVAIPFHSIGLGGQSVSQIKMELGINQSATGNGRAAQLLGWNNSRSHHNSSADYSLVTLSCAEEIEINSSASSVCEETTVVLSASLINTGLTAGLNYIFEKK